MWPPLITFLTHWALQTAVILRVLLRPRREPASRVAWVAVIALIPVGGILMYYLFGEVNPGRRRMRRLRKTVEEMPAFPGSAMPPARLPDRWESLFQAGCKMSGFPAQSGNHITMPPDSNAMVAALVEDIDRAAGHIHLLFYIWLPDRNGCLVAEAVVRAARRGVICRVMADSVGSRLLRHAPQWKAMQEAGVRVAEGAPTGHVLGALLAGRLDMRNHRKIAVIDGAITYCGSQNCADPEFTIKAKYAPWVDAVLRIEGPAARQNLHLFARDWTSTTGERLDALLSLPISHPEGGSTVQVVASGPSFPACVMPEIFIQLLYAAREEVVITTPYYVPGESLQNALCACARRGVRTALILPRRNDSRMVAAASRSYYADLLEAGVRIYEFTQGLLHAKTFVVDGEITLFGSANLDRRSFDLNQENNVLIHDPATAALVRERQDQYLAQSTEIIPAEVAAWPAIRQLWHNTMATFGPLI